MCHNDDFFNSDLVLFVIDLYKNKITFTKATVYTLLHSVQAD